MSWEEAKENLDADGYEIGETCNRDGCEGDIVEDLIAFDEEHISSVKYCNTCNWKQEYDR